MKREDLEKLMDLLPRQIARSVTMKQDYFDKLTNSTFVLNKSNVSENGFFQQFDGLPVYIDDNIERDYEINYENLKE